MIFAARRRTLAAASIAIVFAMGAPGEATAEPPVVAVAANYTIAAERIAAAFTEKTGEEVKLTTGSTGKLYAQIRAGAPFAVMLSADAATPERLEAEGLAAKGSRFTYAFGQLVLWSADEGRFGDGLAAALNDPSVRHVAIANPDLAPYGAAAREALTALGLWEGVRPKIVMGENIGQTFALVESGAAAVGFVALSAVRPPGAPPQGSLIRVPKGAYAPIRQDAVLLLPGAEDETAKAFLAFLGGETARAITAAFGYGVE
ncbi:molybdate ABC transporter substrate-binding protein [Pikeienuella piscinae]|uniref:Molybdate ABC transporter substrate-binding protein n=1 Tax=Pikeienuella piscinae TaxID=2748098 RepID=A0A7L5BTJ3_9RHOB|nr:molybdate ABC transporter substrate-binding protein [Pikeienuella piscinae]QIE54762.1 molybdate ABC transporter substrate-binding protein [Pikeienuella piscinae]